jgi:TolB protein
MLFMVLATLLALPMQNIPAQKDGYPSVSPDGAYLAFTSTRTGDEQVFVISPDGSHEKQLTSSKDKKNAPYWNREGAILFSTDDDDGSSRLFSVMPDSSNLRQIGKVPGRNPKLAPDGEHVIYAVGPWTASRLMLSELRNPKPRQLTGNDSTVWTGWWSPNGKQIAYASQDAAHELHVWTMHADGSNQRQITQVAAQEGRAQWPVWSPDSRQLAIQVGRYNSTESTSHIWVVNLTTSLATKLVPHDQRVLDETPAWFPDGKHIAFQSNRSGRMSIWAMKSDGTELRQITGGR